MHQQHIASLLSTEPANVKLGVRGFSMDATSTLYSVACYAQGRFKELEEQDRKVSKRLLLL